ncbi:MAG: MCE family protein [Deltaproteobacteria bacterium]|nr:MAG: MCE family protein [Deltaproteobacteria bacterium]
MHSITTEFKVGLFVLIGAVLVIGGYWWSFDGVKRGEAAYILNLRAPTAQGLWSGTPVRVAGVDVGAIEDIAIEGRSAHITMKVRDQHQFPTDSTAEIRSSGMLGDMFIAIRVGTEESLIPDGGWIDLGNEPGSFDEITRQVEDITEDVAAITEVLREMIEDDRNTDAIEATIANVEALSAELRFMAERNRADVDAIVDSVRRLTDTMDKMAAETSSDVDEELEKIKEVTDTLQAAMDDIESVTSKIDNGEGTIGALVNDDTTIREINETIENANGVIESFSGLHADVYYTGRWYVGSQPANLAAIQADNPAFTGNPLANTGSNTIGIELKPQEDFWWVFEINDYPTGTVYRTTRYLPELGEVYTEWRNEADYRFTFQMAKRWGDFGFRLGVKENGGGVGMTWYTLDDRLRLEGDIFDFEFGSYPMVTDSGIPNLRVFAHYEPVHHIYMQVGGEQILLGARHGYMSAFAGVGFRFTDDDIKLLLATLPLGF